MVLFPCIFVLRRWCCRASGFAFAESIYNRFHDSGTNCGFLVAAGLRFLFCLFKAFFKGFQISNHQFRFYDFCIANRINTAFNVSDVTVFKATQDVDDGVGFADVGKKLVAESLTFGGSFYQAGNINEFKLGRYDVFRVDDSCQFLQSFIGYGNTAGIRFNGTKRKVCRLSSNCLSQSVKKS